MTGFYVSKQLEHWCNEIEKISLEDLVHTLNCIKETARVLSGLTRSSSNENDLSYRFRDLETVSDESQRKLKTFIEAFCTDLRAYIKTVRDAELTAAENIRKEIDEFAESANKISSLDI